MSRSTLRACVTMVIALWLATVAGRAWAQEGVFLSEEEAPRAVFPQADEFTRAEIPASDDLRQLIRGELGRAETSVWEDRYVTFTARKAGEILGLAIFVDEIGKHRPITFVVGVRQDGHVNDVAVVAYREAIGGEVRAKRFLGQYRDKNASDGLRQPTDIKNIAGATLSVEAASRAVKKALAVAKVAFRSGESSLQHRAESR